MGVETNRILCAMDAKEDIKRRLSVEDVVSSYIELKRAGRNFKALSPFNTEKTPSFMVSPDKQIWHDFSANKGGDIFSFVMEMEGVDFRGALEILARKAGVDLSKYDKRQGGTGKKKIRIQQALDLATKFYHLQLSKHSAALDYIKKKRGYTPDTIKRFLLGYAPGNGQTLRQYLLRKGFTDAELYDAGLTALRKGVAGDMFRDRIIVPLMDGQGHVVGFTARLLTDRPGAPKYINTPQTLLYDKSRHVFGLHLAKEAMRKQDWVALVEGNMDVIASHQAGVTNCVATAGTALTPDHLKQISRLTPNIRLAFDQDRAGIEATERAVPIASAAGVNLSIVTIPSDKDPDALIQHDPQMWHSVLENALYVMDWLVEHYAKRFNVTSAQGKRNFSDVMVAILHGLADPVEQEHYVNIVSKVIDVSPHSIYAKLTAYAQTKKSTYKRRLPSKALGAQVPQLTYTYTDTYLGMLILYPETRDSIAKLEGLDFMHPWRQAVLQQLRENPKISPKALKTDEEYVKITTFRAEEFYGQSSSSERLTEAMAIARRIASEIHKLHNKQLARQLQDAHEASDDQAIQRLLEQANQRLKKE